MKKTNNILVIGCCIPSLYAAIKCIDMGYDVTILEKRKYIFPISDIAYYNFKLYNDNHILFANLLKSYGIKSEKVNEIYHNKALFDFIKLVSQKSKSIPVSILMSHSLTGLCQYLMLGDQLMNLKINETEFDFIFNKMTALECLNLLSNDLVDTTGYNYVDNTSFTSLLNKMVLNFITKGGNIIYNTEVKHIKYLKKKFIIIANTNTTLNTNSYTQQVFHSEYLLTTISRLNLSSFCFWNNEQKTLLNSVSTIDNTTIYNTIDKIIHMPIHVNSLDCSKNVNKYILDDLHIVYPSNSNSQKHNYIWNKGCNPVLIREKIKFMYNDRFFILSESFTKNNMFINYSLEYIDSTISAFLYKK